MSWVESVWGTKPRVAKPIPVTTSQAQQDLTDANIKNFANIAKQGDLYSQYLQSALEKQLPGYAETLQAGQKNALAVQEQAAPYIRGELPQAVIDQINRQAAYTGLGAAGYNQPFLRSNQLRELGLGVMQGQQFGANLAGQGANTAALWSKLAAGTIYDPTRDYITPAQQLAVNQWNEQRRQAARQQQFNVEAAPSPVAKGVSDTLIGLISAYLSKGGGGTSATQPADPYSTNVVGHEYGQGFLGFGKGEAVYGSSPIDTGSIASNFSGFGAVPYNNAPVGYPYAGPDVRQGDFYTNNWSIG